MSEQIIITFLHSTFSPTLQLFHTQIVGSHVILWRLFTNSHINMMLHCLYRTVCVPQTVRKHQTLLHNLDKDNTVHSSERESAMQFSMGFKFLQRTRKQTSDWWHSNTSPMFIAWLVTSENSSPEPVVFHLILSWQQPDHAMVISREDEASPQCYFLFPLSIEILPS